MNRADKNWAHFKKIKYLKSQSPSPIFFRGKKNLEKFNQFSTLKNDFEYQNSEIFEEVVQNNNGDII